MQKKANADVLSQLPADMMSFVVKIFMHSGTSQKCHVDSMRMQKIKEMVGHDAKLQTS